MQLKVAATHLPYELLFHPLENEGVILDDKKITIEFLPFHRIECWGIFLFREKKILRKIEIEETKKYNIPSSFFF